MSTAELRHSYSSITLFENCPLRYYRQRIISDVVDQGGEAARYGVAVHEELEHRIRDNRKLPRHLQPYESLCIAMESLGGTILAEQEVALDRKLQPCEFGSEDMWIRAIIDVLILKGDKAYMFDWKTGKRRVGSFQLKLCAALIFRHYPEIKEVEAGYVWLKENQIDRENYKRKDQTDMWKDILPRIKRIEQALNKDVWPARPSGLCRFCPAKQTCQFAQL